MINKEVEMILEYKDLTIDIQPMWKVITKVIPVIMGQMEPSRNHSENTSATYWESTKSRNCKKNSHIGHCTRS